MSEIFENTKRDDSSNRRADGTSQSVQSPLNLSMENLTSCTLQFLSTASPEAIIGVTVTIAACTYFVLGRIGLLLIGGLGGFVFHATWERQNKTDGSNLRKEKSLDIIRRLLDLRDQTIESRTEHTTNEITTFKFEVFQPETAAALKELVEAIIRDYVKWWYRPILPRDSSFPEASQQALTQFIMSISNHLLKKRAVDIFLNFLMNSSSITIVFLSELSAALSNSPGSAAEAVHSYLSVHPDSSLSNALDERHQTKKLKMSTADFLKSFLDKSIYDCEPARIFLNEIFSSLILENTLKSCSKSEWINGWIVTLLEKGDPDFSQAIDAGMDAERQDANFHENTDTINSTGLSESVNGDQHSQLLKKCDGLSKAKDDINNAAEEVKRLSILIAEEDAKKKRFSHLSRIIGTSKAKDPLASIESTKRTLDLDSINSNIDKVSSETTFNDLQTSKISANTQCKSQFLAKLDESRAPSGLRGQSALPSTLQHNPSFTNFDQLNMNSLSINREGSLRRNRKMNYLTLHHAKITVCDDNYSNEKGKLRNKPNADYLIQIEPASSSYPGWMIVRRYPDFESLHEILRRIAQVSGATEFTEQHQSLPSWKDHTKESLRIGLERYLRDSCWYQPLAESEGMKRFFKKDQEYHISSQGSKNGFPGIGWSTPSAFETMGKGVLDVLTSAPKGVAEGGKAITGVFNNIGNLGHRKSNGCQIDNLSRMGSIGSINSLQVSRASEDSLRSISLGQVQQKRVQSVERKSGNESMVMDESLSEPHSPSSQRSSLSGHQVLDPSQENLNEISSPKATPSSFPSQSLIDPLNLPPPPTEMPDDYGSHNVNGRMVSHSCSGFNTTSSGTENCQQSQEHQASSTNSNLASGVKVIPQKDQSVSTPLTESETRVAVELIFAVINEMYTISSAWNIRRTLLTAAKTYFLRPGNPSLLKIQSLIQESVISANTSDSGIAAHLRKLRENCLPTEAELREMPSEISLEDKEKLRIKARSLLIKRGVPKALTGVMGQAATSEAMGRIFDCLQIEEVARGLIFGLLLQGLRAVFF